MNANRRGLALPVAMFTIAIIVLFIAGSAFTATQEARAAIGSVSERQALERAEFGAGAVLRDWQPSWNVSTLVGQTLGPFTYPAAGGSAVVRVTRTSVTNWWIVSEGTSGPTTWRSARRTVNAALRLDLLPAPPDAALSVVDSASVTGTGRVDGSDSSGTSGLCASLTSTGTAGVAALDTTRILGRARVSGSPPLQPDTTVATRSLAIDSAARAHVVLPHGAVVTPAAVTVSGACDTLVMSNWGDPGGAGPCGAYLPVIRALGDLTVRGGAGQGILIVNGDVVFEQGAAFHGLVLANDDFATGMGGGSVFGAVIAADVRRGPGDRSVVGNGGQVRRSTCSLLVARLGAAAPTRVKQRWWAEF